MILNWIVLLLIIKLAIGGPILPNEQAELLNSRLSFYGKRFSNVLKDLPPNYADNMKSLMALFNQARTTSDLKVKEKFLEKYTDGLPEDFGAYLQLKLDEQYLNEEILIEEWYLREIMSQINDAQLASEIANLLPKYQIAFKTQPLDEKYELFGSIAETFSKNLLAILDANPEDSSVLNAHLKFFQEFLLYLLQERLAGEFEGDIKVLLSEVESSMSGKDVKQKLSTLDRFDDFDTKLARFMDYKIHEFEMHKFNM